MNVNVVTTGLRPLNIGSVEAFVLAADLNDLPWNLAGATVSLSILDPLGNQTTYGATYGVPPGQPASFGASWFVSWTVVAPVGMWFRGWSITDSLGVHQVSDPIEFVVQASP